MLQFRDLPGHAKGHVGIVFGLALLPLMVLVGAAVDYARGANANTGLQDAVDVTALMLSKTAATLTAAQLNIQAAATFGSIYSKPGVSNLAISASYVTGGQTSLTVSATGSVATAFMKIVGIPTMNLGGTSTVTGGASRLRVALVLDNTLSMADDGKLAALKTATLNLLTQLQGAAANDGDVYVSIIPFNKDVNVGASNYSATWLRWDLWNAATPAQALLYALLGNAAHSSWNGCVTDRDPSYDTAATSPLGSLATQFPAESYGSCPVSLMGLSYDWIALRAKVATMVAAGTTNQTIGLQWGFQSLATNSPLAVPAMDPNYNYNQVVILLTDGLNTQSRSSTIQSTIDARTLLACTNIKAAGITLYAIQVDTSGDPTSTMLQSCATDSGKFSLLTSATSIIATFNDIGTSLSQLRVSR